MRPLLFVSLTFLLFLAACGRSTSSRSINQGNGQPATPLVDSDSGAIRSYPLEPVVATPMTPKANQPLLEATPRKFTVNTNNKTITLSADLKVDGKDLGLVEFSGTIDQQAHLAHLQSKNRDTQATVLCLDLENCLDAAVVIYHRYKNRNLEVQFRTKGGSPVSSTQPGFYEEDDEVLLAPLKPAPPKPSHLEAPSQLEEEDDGADGESTGFVGQLPPDMRPLGTTNLSGTLPQAIGRQSRGRLINAEMLPNEGKGFVRMRKNSNTTAWGTTLLLRILKMASAEMADKFPDRPPLLVGDISQKNGGKLGRHKSHKNGLDMDIGFPRKSDWLTGFVNTVLKRNTVDSRVDLERIWMFAKLMVSSKHLINIYTATPIKNAICSYVRSIGEYPKSSEDLSFKALRSFYYVEGHHDHMHVRLQCPSTSPHCLKTDPIPVKETGCPAP